MSIEIVTSFERQSNASDTSMSGAKIYVYNVGTTTLRTIYSDEGLAIAAANPIICDSAGRHDMRYTATGSYKIVVKTSADVTVYTRDNIDGRVPIGSGALGIGNGGTGATTAGAALTNLGAASAADLTAQAAELAALSGTLNSVEKTHIATGTTAQRPGSPIAGDIRRNTTTSLYEGYTGSAWVNFATNALTTFQPTYQVFTSGSAATYTTPAGVKWIKVRMVGGGGGGGGTAGVPGTGGTTTFNSINATGGSPGANAAGTALGGAGGTGGTGTATLRLAGAAGGKGTQVGGADESGGTGGNGGGTFMGAGGGTNAGAAAVNSGGGGGGVTGPSAANNGAGGGGGGEYAEIVIGSPATSYTYTVGAAGTAGTGAGAAAAGVIVVEEYYV